MQNSTVEKEELLSVIIPVYNVEEYLRKCLDSVVNQTYKNLEILLVDDGSTDMSGEICKEYAAKDSRVHYYRQKNKGSGEARNFGIANAQGDFITFLDSDDYWSTDYAAMMMSGFEEDVDVTICDLIYVYPDREEFSRIRLPEDKAVNVNEDLDTINKARTFLCGKVYRKSLIVENGVEQPSMAINDIPIVTFMIAKARKLRRVPEPLYYYLRIREGSYVNTMKALTSFADAIDEMYKNFDAGRLTVAFERPLQKMLYSQYRFALRKGLNAVKNGASKDEYFQLLSVMNSCLNRHWPVHPSVYGKTFSSTNKDVQEGIRNFVIRDDDLVKEGEADFTVAFEDEADSSVDLQIKRHNGLDGADLYWDIADQILFSLPQGGQ